VLLRRSRLVGEAALIEHGGRIIRGASEVRRAAAIAQSPQSSRLNVALLLLIATHGLPELLRILAGLMDGRGDLTAAEDTCPSTDRCGNDSPHARALDRMSF